MSLGGDLLDEGAGRGKMDVRCCSGVPRERGQDGVVDSALKAMA
jgi:hypothetical protein